MISQFFFHIRLKQRKNSRFLLQQKFSPCILPCSCFFLAHCPQLTERLFIDLIFFHAVIITQFRLHTTLQINKELPNSLLQIGFFICDSGLRNGSGLLFVNLKLYGCIIIHTVICTCYTMSCCSNLFVIIIIGIDNTISFVNRLCFMDHKFSDSIYSNPGLFSIQCISFSHLTIRSSLFTLL